MSATRKLLGYSYLIDAYGLAARMLPALARTDTSVKGREVVRQGNQDLLLFEPKYQPDDSLTGHLQFALRYEGINLEVLGLLFRKTGEAELNSWLKISVESAYARRAGFLYEWLTGHQLNPLVPAKAGYVQILDTDLQIGPVDGERNTRFRVTNNLPGTPNFCPLVRRTPFLEEMITSNLRDRIKDTLAKYDQDLLTRAATFLYLKETQSSNEIEREKPSATRTQRFVNLLREANNQQPLTEARLIELQHAVLDPRFHEFTWRSKQNWIGTDHGHRQKIDLVPPRPEDLLDLMQGLLETAGKDPEMDPVVLATAIAFGFVFIHPFMDGNGRIHRYLIHDVLAKAEFTPRGIILPVSAVILANLQEYVETLECFSAPLLARTEWNPDLPDVPATGNEAIYFRFFDATPQAEFLYKALVRCVEDDLQKEIEFILGFDQSRAKLNELADWPDHSLDLFIWVVQQNDFKLSKTKRQSHFDWMTAEEISTSEALVKQEFEKVKVLQ